MPEGMSNKEYFQFLREVEDSLYEPYDLQPWTEEIYTKGEFLHTPYMGRRNKTFSQPMVDFKEDHFRMEGQRCDRCMGWQFRGEDTITPIKCYKRYRADGTPYYQEIHFIPYFAARRPHP